MARRYVKKGANEYETRYLNDDEGGYPAGVTIAEYEARQGWPLFTIWPEAADARSWRDKGWFLYTNATDEERAEMTRTRVRCRCVDCGGDLSVTNAKGVCRHCESGRQREATDRTRFGLADLPGLENLPSLRRAENRSMKG